MRKNGGEVPGQGLLEHVVDREVEMCGPSVFISWLPHLVHSGQASGQGTVGAG